MTAVTTRRVRHRVRRLRRGHRRRRGAHGPPPDGRGRRPEPAHPGREAGRPVRARDGLDRGEPARPAARHHQGAGRPVRARLAGEDRQGVRRRQAAARPGHGGHPSTPRPAGDWPQWTKRRGRPRWRSWPRSRRRSARTARSPPATRPDSTTAPPPACSPGPMSPPSSACRSRCGWSSYGFAGVEPEVMGFGPIPSTEKALRSAGLSIADIGLFELNEAFAVQVLAFLDHFGIADDDPRVNPWGGAIAIGHPLASSGVRLMTQLAREFAEHPEVRYGLTAMCVGIGMGGTVIWENPTLGGQRSERARGIRRTRSSRRRCCGSCAVPGLARPAALITLDNGFDHTKPNTLRPRRAGQPGRRDRPRRSPPTRRSSRSPASRTSSASAPTSPACRCSRDRDAGAGRSAGTATRCFARLPTAAVADVRLRQRRGHGRRAGAGPALPLPHALGGGGRDRAARGVARPGPGLGRHPAAAEPDRRHQRGPGHRPEPVAAEQDAAPGRRPPRWASRTCCSSRPTSSSGRWSGPRRSCAERPR